MAQQNSDDSFPDRYNTLLQRQAELYFDETLSALRSEFTYAQLWYFYNNAALLYWSQELTNLQLLQQQPYTANPFQGEASAVQSRLYEVMGEVAAGTRIVFDQLRADPGFPNWSQRWETAWRTAAQAFAPELAKLEADFPALKSYTELSQRVAQTAQAVAATALIADQVTEQYQQLTQRRQRILRTIDYAQQMAALQQRWQELMSADITLHRLNGLGTHLTNLLNELQHSVHATIAACLAVYGTAVCVDPQHNRALQDFLPYYSAYSNSTLRRVAAFQEEYSKKQNAFSLSRPVRALQQKLQALVQSVTPDLRHAENQFIHGIQAIPEASDLGQLLRQLVQAARQLEAQ